jgi:hypothetical protein
MRFGTIGAGAIGQALARHSSKPATLRSSLVAFASNTKGNVGEYRSF